MGVGGSRGHLPPLSAQTLVSLHSLVRPTRSPGTVQVGVAALVPIWSSDCFNFNPASRKREKVIKLSGTNMIKIKPLHSLHAGRFLMQRLDGKLVTGCACCSHSFYEKHFFSSFQICCRGIVLALPASFIFTSWYFAAACLAYTDMLLPA